MEKLQDDFLKHLQALLDLGDARYETQKHAKDSKKWMEIHGEANGINDAYNHMIKLYNRWFYAGKKTKNQKP